jgi:large subunit ribosomal protein L35
MPKLKTHKSVVKKVRLTKKGKVMRRKTGQNHYNSKDNGQEGRVKRTDIRLFKADEANVLKALPYSK